MLRGVIAWLLLVSFNPYIKILREGLPTTKLIPGKVHIPPRLISRVNARIQLVRLGQHVGQHAVHMRGELLETGFGAVEAMDVD